MTSRVKPRGHFSYTVVQMTVQGYRGFVGFERETELKFVRVELPKLPGLAGLAREVGVASEVGTVLPLPEATF